MICSLADWYIPYTLSSLEWLFIFQQHVKACLYKANIFRPCIAKNIFIWPLAFQWKFQFISVQFSHSVVPNSLWPHESQHAKSPCPSPTPGVHSNSCPSSRWCHPAISSSVTPFSSCPQSLPASGSFPMSQLFAWGGQSIGVSALTSVLPMNTQDWTPLGWTGWISLQSKGLSRVFFNTTFKSINSSVLSIT